MIMGTPQLPDDIANPQVPDDIAHPQVPDDAAHPHPDLLSDGQHAQVPDDAAHPHPDLLSDGQHAQVPDDAAHPHPDLLSDGQHAQVPDDAAHPHPDLLSEGQQPSSDLLGDGTAPDLDLLGDGTAPDLDLLGDGTAPDLDLLGDGTAPDLDLLGDGTAPDLDLLGDGTAPDLDLLGDGTAPDLDLLGDGTAPDLDLLGDGTAPDLDLLDDDSLLDDDPADESGPLARNIPGTSVPLDPGDLPPDESHVIIDKDGNRVTVLPEITIHGIPPGRPSDVGSSFTSQDAAAIAALAEIDTASTDKNAEYAGNIYRNADGTYSFSRPVSSGSSITSDPRNSPVPAGAIIVGTYHSHAGEFRASDEFFSGPWDDKGKAELGKKLSYLVTPRGQLLKYTPPSLLPTSLQQTFPSGRVTKLQ